MPDGHVVQESQPFEERASCEDEARQQGLPLEGMSRSRAT